MTQESTNSPVTPHKVGTIYLEAKGNNVIHYILSCVKIIKPVSGNINFELSNIDYENKKLTYTFEYTDGQPPSDGTEPASGGAMGNYLLPIYMPHKIGENEYFIPTEIEVVNAADSSKKKKGSVSTSTPIRLDDPLIESDDPRVNVAKVTTAWDDGSQTLTTYFLFVIAKTNSFNSRKLAITTDQTTINCSYSVDENSAENDGSARAAIGAVMSLEDGYYTEVVLSNDGISNSANVPLDNDGKYSQLLSFTWPST